MISGGAFAQDKACCKKGAACTKSACCKDKKNCSKDSNKGTTTAPKAIKQDAAKKTY